MDHYKLAPALVLAVLLALSLTPASAQQVAEIQLNPQQTSKKECIAQIRVAEGAGTFTTTSGQVIPLQGNTNCVCIHQDGTATPDYCPSSILAFSVGGGTPPPPPPPPSGGGGGGCVSNQVSCSQP